MFLDELSQIFKETSLLLNKNLDILYGGENQPQQEEKPLSQNLNSKKENLCSQSPQSIRRTKTAEDLTFFDDEKINENEEDQAFCKEINEKIIILSMNRKELLFSRIKKEQEQICLKQERQIKEAFLGQSIPSNFSRCDFSIKNTEKTQNFTLSNEDLLKLQPGMDLNDTIIESYLKILISKMVSSLVERKTHIYSTFFMKKLLPNALRDEKQKYTKEQIHKKAQSGYPQIRRWTRKIDIFSKKYLVFPINGFNHWNCVIVVLPERSTEKNESILRNCKILYMDSLFRKRQIIYESIKYYLSMELEDKKKIEDKEWQTIPVYQLLLPRQTNSHDCGLYMLAYIEYFLQNEDKLQENYEIVENREKLQIFPRTLIFSMRKSLVKLFLNLQSQTNSEGVIIEYMNQKEKIIAEAPENEYDRIDDLQLEKYFLFHQIKKEQKSTESVYSKKFRFYIDAEVNYLDRYN